MSVLNRKLFSPVRMHAGGTPPHAPAGHLHTYDQELSDQEIQTQLTNLQSEIGNLQKEVQPDTYTGIMEGFDSATDEQGTINPLLLAESIYPKKSDAELRAEAEKIYSTDLTAERAEVERQKQEDIAAGLIGFGARLATGRGNALDVLGQAAQQTLPEFMAARRATRKDVMALKGQEKAAKKAISSYVMTKQQEDDAKRAQLMIDAVFKNLDFDQEIAKMDKTQNWDLDTTRMVVKNVETGDNEEITLRKWVENQKLPVNERKYLKETDYNAPFVAWDNNFNANRMFTNYEAFAKANKASPERFEDKKDDVGPAKVSAMKVGNFTHPNTGEYGKWMIQELDDGTYMIPQLDKNGDVLLQSNGHPIMIPIGAGASDLVVGKDVELTAEDLLPPKVLNEQISTILLYDRNIRSLDKIISNLAEDKLRAGIMGSINEMIQIGQGMITDILDSDQKNGIFLSVQEEMKNIDRIAETPEDAEAIKALFDPTDPRSAEFFGDFDPALAENRTRANAIAYAVARARKTSGRLNLDDIRTARESLQITGFRDARTAITELYTIRDELSDANDDMKMLYKFNGGKFPEGYTGTTGVKKENLPKIFYTDKGDIDTIMFPWEEIK
jgi:predicted RNA-binding protein with RPS1 domain